jgi:hypothetical protein
LIELSPWADVWSMAIPPPIKGQHNTETIIPACNEIQTRDYNIWEAQDRMQGISHDLAPSDIMSSYHKICNLVILYSQNLYNVQSPRPISCLSF